MDFGSLKGIRVVDLSRVLGGPYCTMILADHGAEVIKVEPPQGDDTRDWGPPFLEYEDGGKDASYYLGVNRNKRSIALDIGRAEGREVLMRLLEDADVLVENFKPGSMKRWNLDYEADLAPRFPSLVHCRVSGFGEDGPFGGLPGYDVVLQAMSGLMSVNGDAESGALKIGTPVVDLATGLYATIGILMALVERNSSGRGQFVDMALYDCGMAMLHPQGANWLLNGVTPKPLGNVHSNLAPCDKFRTSTCEIMLACGNDRQFRRLTEEIDRPEIADDPRFATNGGRLENREALKSVLEHVFADLDGEELARSLLAKGVPVGAVRTVDQAIEADQSAARHMLTELGPYRGIATPVKLSRTPGETRHEPPRFAADTAELLREIGYSEHEISSLRMSGVAPATRNRPASKAP